MYTHVRILLFHVFKFQTTVVVVVACAAYRRARRPQCVHRAVESSQSNRIATDRIGCSSSNATRTTTARRGWSSTWVRRRIICATRTRELI
jgi:hypothetical protein